MEIPRKGQRAMIYRKKTLYLMLVLYTVTALYMASYFYSETLAHIYPNAEKTDLSEISSHDKNALTENDYALIQEQTGLGKAAVQSLDSLNELTLYQDIYYEDAEYVCQRNSIFSHEEHLKDKTQKFASLEKGDILITRSSHVFSWRNGHTAIVIDSDEGRTLEAVVIGSRSSVQDISKWEKYPNALVLRLKGATKQERERIAENAEKYLTDKPYNLLVGLWGRKYSDLEEVSSTQCAHLVWLAYASCGYDIDSDGGLICTPKDIAESELFEVVQRVGW
jgi:uncharacterized protein YycO